jgi:hypothetical protein
VAQIFSKSLYSTEISDDEASDISAESVASLKEEKEEKVAKPIPRGKGKPVKEEPVKEEPETENAEEEDEDEDDDVGEDEYGIPRSTSKLC